MVYLFITPFPEGQLNERSFIRMQIVLFRKVLLVSSERNSQFLKTGMRILELKYRRSAPVKFKVNAKY